MHSLRPVDVGLTPRVFGSRGPHLHGVLVRCQAATTTSAKERRACENIMIIGILWISVSCILTRSATVYFVQGAVQRSAVGTGMATPHLPAGFSSHARHEGRLIFCVMVTSFARSRSTDFQRYVQRSQDNELVTCSRMTVQSIICVCVHRSRQAICCTNAPTLRRVSDAMSRFRR